MNNKVKILAASIAAMTLVGCGSETIEITKPDGTHQFQPATTKVTRSTAHFSKADAEKVTAIFKEIETLKEIVPSYTSSEEDYPKADQTFTFAHGDGSAVEAAYKAHYAAFQAVEKKALAEFKAEYNEKAADVAKREEALKAAQAVYDEATASIKPTLTKIDELKAAHKAQDDLFHAATDKMLEAYNAVIIDKSIPVKKISSRDLSRLSYNEATCKTTGFESGRWDTFSYSMQYDPTLCITKKLGKMPASHVKSMSENTELVSLLDEQIKVQVSAMLEQGDLRLRKREVNGYTQQIKVLNQEVKDAGIVIKNKYDRTLRDMTRAIEKANTNFVRGQNNLDRIAKGKESSIKSAVRSGFGSGKYSEYVQALSNYQKAALNSVIDISKFEVEKEANYGVIPISVNNEKPYQVIFDKVVGEDSEMFVIDTVALKTYFEKAKIESPVALMALKEHKAIKDMFRLEKIYKSKDPKVMDARVVLNAASELKILIKE